MIKICYVTTVPATLDAFVLKSAQYIHENTDWDITFLCDYDSQFENRLPDYIHYCPVKMERGIKVSGIKAILEMRRIFKKQGFTLIQYSTPNASLYASLAGWLANVPVRLYCQWGLVYVGYFGLKRYILKSLEKLICGLSTSIEPDSYSNLRFAISERLYSSEKGSVIWNGSACGVDLSKFDYSKKSDFNKEIRETYSIPEDAFVYGFVGRITRDKGVNELLEVFHNILDANTYLIMVGSDEADETIDSSLFEWSKQSPFVIYTGFTNEVEKYMAALNCYVLPSYREGFGMSVIEAEAMGVPVIVTNIPGPIDAVKNLETGLIVEKKNVEQLKDAMLKMKCEDTSELGRKGHQFVRGSFDQSMLFQHILEDRKRLLSMIQ